MGKVIPFTGEFYTRKVKSDDFVENLACSLVEKMQVELGFDTSSPEFLINMAWLIKFIEVIVDSELGIANELANDLKVIEHG